MIRDSLIDYLVDQGFAAEGVVHGQAALEHLTGSGARPCLIILDLMMPVMDGRSFREAQLRDPDLSQIPVVIISAYRDLATIAGELRPAGHLEKPLKLQDLLRFVKQYCCGEPAGD